MNTANSKNKISMGLNIGSSSILVTFILLCLVTFATLSLVSANADYKLSQKIATRTTAYYSANNQAEQILSDIDSAVKSERDYSTSLADFQNRISNALSSYPMISIGQDTNTLMLDYMLAITDTQTLHVTLSIPYAGTECTYHIDAWQVENTDSWDADNTITLVE